ncbi:ABC transporter substrate-binding protein, partial [bacterium]|nr:ABC transporter substrate-binding protein [bacterium]
GAAVALAYEGLVTFDRDGRVAPALAAAWSTSDDGLLWRFELDPAARDSEGRPVTSAEVVASFERLLAKETASPRAWVLQGIDGADAFRAGAAEHVAGLRGGDGFVELRLAAPRASLLGLLAMPNAAILPVDGDVTGHVATGPWRLVEHVRDARLRFARNPHWHGRAPAVTEIHVRILPDEFTRVAEFEVGNLDLLEIPDSEARRFRDKPELAAAVQGQVGLATEYVGLNHDDPVLRDARVRRALNHAVNVDLILEKILDGRGVRATGSIPPTLPGGGTGQPFAYDPDRARALLREAGVDPEWVLELWQRPSPRASQVLEAVQSDLRAIGMASRIRLRDWSALKASIDAGETAAFFVNWYADYPDAENFLVPLFHSRNIGGGGNRARVARPEIDARLDALDLVTDPERRAELAAALDRDIQAGAPWIALWHPIQEIAASDRIASYRPHPIFSAERWLDVRLAEPDAP